MRRGGELLVSEKNDPLMRKTGSALRALREENDFTREQHCERVGITVRHLSAIELGEKNPSSSTLIRLIRSMGAPSDRVVYPEVFAEEQDLKQIARLSATCSTKQKKLIIAFIKMLLSQEDFE